MPVKSLFTSLIVFFMISDSLLFAQHIEGVYQMSGGHEMVAAFEFKKDSSFEFYFVYGAVDRFSKGHFTIHDRTIFLHTVKIPGKDFNIVKQEKRDSGTTIKVSNPNAALVHNILGIFKKGYEEDQQMSDRDGIIHSTMNDCDSVVVIHTLFPDVPTAIKTSRSNVNNYFELTLNPSLAELSFQGFTLSIKDEEITGSLPWLFEREQVVFVKGKE